MSVSAPSLHSEKIPEDSRYLRLLQQLGDHAVREVACDNPVFQQHFAGALAPNKREIIKEQSDVLGDGVRKLAATAGDDAEKANSHFLATILRQLAQQQAAVAGGADTKPPRGAFEIVHPATRRLLMILDELGARKNYIETAGALYTLLKLALAERILFPDENTLRPVRQAIHSQVRVASLVAADDGFIPADDDPWGHEVFTANDGLITNGVPTVGNIVAARGSTGARGAVTVEKTIEDLEQALESYASAYYPLRECIMPGMDAVIEAKKRFYRELASDFEEDSLQPSQPLKVSNLS